MIVLQYFADPKDKSVTDDDITDALRVECIESDSHSDMTGNETADKQKNSPNNDKSFIERNKEVLFSL